MPQPSKLDLYRQAKEDMHSLREAAKMQMIARAKEILIEYERIEKELLSEFGIKLPQRAKKTRKPRQSTTTAA